MVVVELFHLVCKMHKWTIYNGLYTMEVFYILLELFYYC